MTFRAVNIHPCYTAGAHATASLTPVRSITVSLQKQMQKSGQTAKIFDSMEKSLTSTFIPYTLSEKERVKT